MNSTCTWGAVYRFKTGGYHDSGLLALMIASRLRYILSYWNLKFTCSLYNVIMNICKFLIKYAWILNLGQIRFPYRCIQSVNIFRSETGIFRVNSVNTMAADVWLIVSPGIQQLYHWQRRINNSLPLRRRISMTCAISMLRSYSKFKCIVMFDKKKKSTGKC